MEPGSPAAPKLEPEHRQSSPVTSGRPLRVLHLHSGNMMGGIESILLTLAECADLAPNLHQEFALTFDSSLAAQLRSKQVRVNLLPQVRLRHLPSIYQSRRQLRMLLDDSNFDIVISHAPWIQLIFADVVRQHRIPLVHWMHGPYNGHWLQKLASFQEPDFAICNSQWTQSTLDRFYRVPSRVIYCPVLPPIEASRQQKRSELGIAGSEVVILIASRIEPLKGHLALLRALSRLRTSARWKLLIAGAPNSPSEGAYLESLKNEIVALKLTDRVHFLGHRSDVPALLAAADIYCQPNTYPEGFGVIFVQALQGGVPVVTSAMGGAQEILDPSTGILVAPGDIDAIALAVTQLIEDEPLRRSLGHAGPARAQILCDPATQMQILIETLQSVAGHDRGAAAR